jgi:hypothetical protein
MRSRITFFVLLFAVSVLALPLLAHAAKIPFLDPILPDQTCPAAWGMLITVLDNIVSVILTVAIVFLAPLMIAYSGFLFVMNQGESGKISQAKQILLNTVIGIIIALAAWLIVNALLSALTGQSFSVWTSPLSGGAQCLTLAAGGVSAPPSSGGTSTNTGTGSAAVTLPTPSTVPGNACNPATITAAVPTATPSQANLLACIAKGESSCGASGGPFNLNYSWNKPNENGLASSAAGAYQVLLSSNSECYDNPICEAAGGTPGVPLNCKSGFDSKGFPLTSGAGATTVGKCVQAAGNVQCSAAAAVCLLKKQPFAAAYATDPYTSVCLSAYGA